MDRLVLSGFYFSGSAVWLGLTRRRSTSADSLRDKPDVIRIGTVHTTTSGCCFLCYWRSVHLLQSSLSPESANRVVVAADGCALGFGALAAFHCLGTTIAFVWVILRTPRLIVTPGPYLGALLCGFVMTPWILWNMDRDFAHLSHEFGHVNSAK